MNQWTWGLLHSLVVTVCTLLMSIPFGITIMLLMIVNGIIHYAIDYFKPRLAAKHPIPNVIYFISDQLLHIAILFFFSRFAPTVPYFVLFDPIFIEVLIALEIVTSFFAICNQLLLKAAYPMEAKKQGNSNSSGFFAKNEKWTGNLSRLLYLGGICLSVYFNPYFAVLALAALAINLIQYKTFWKQWMSTPYFVMKLLLDMGSSMIGAAFLLVL